MLLILCCGFFSQAKGSQCPLSVPNDLSKPFPQETRLNIYNFYSQPNFERVYLASYKKVGELFSPDQLGTLSGQKPMGAEGSILQRLQNFSTATLEGVKTSPKDLKAERTKLLSMVDTNQVVFFEVTKEHLKSAVDEDPERFPPHVISDQPDFNHRGVVGVRESGLWVVAGQYRRPGHETYTEKGFSDDVTWELPGGNRGIGSEPEVPQYRIIGINIQSLPWQRSSDLLQKSALPVVPYEPAIYLDREKHPIVFEVGRLAQNGHENVESLYKAAVAWMYNETNIGMQGRTEDAYVYARVNDKANKRRMTAMGFRVLEGSLVEESAVLFVPLSKLVERFGLGDISLENQNISNLLPGRSKEYIVGLLEWTKAHYSYFLDFIVEEAEIVQQEPIVVADFSSNYSLLIEAFVLQTQVDEADRSSLREALHKTADYRWIDFRNGEFLDWVKLQRHKSKLTALNAVVLTNLDGALADKNPSYLTTLLVAMEGQLRNVHKEMDVLADQYLDLLASTDIQYVIATHDRRIVKQAQALGMMDIEMDSVVYGERIEYFFKIDRKAFLEKASLSSPAFVSRLLESGLDKGLWFFDSLLANPARL